MSINCPAPLFKEFKDGVDSWVSQSGEGLSFLYEAMDDGLDFLALIPYSIDEISEEAMNDWERFEYWLNDIHHSLTTEDIAGDYIAPDDEVTPLEYFGSKEAIFDKVHKILSDNKDDKYEAVVGFKEIKSRNDSLYLIYTGFDGWALGHSDCVLVVSDLDDLANKHGFSEEVST